VRQAPGKGLPRHYVLALARLAVDQRFSRTAALGKTMPTANLQTQEIAGVKCHAGPHKRRSCAKLSIAILALNLFPGRDR